jgi:hypothetical protein
LVYTIGADPDPQDLIRDRAGIQNRGGLISTGSSVTHARSKAAAKGRGERARMQRATSDAEREALRRASLHAPDGSDPRIVRLASLAAMPSVLILSIMVALMAAVVPTLPTVARAGFAALSLLGIAGLGVLAWNAARPSVPTRSRQARWRLAEASLFLAGLVVLAAAVIAAQLLC